LAGKRHRISEIGGSWGVSIAGVELGAYVGALAVPFAPIAVPVLSFVGGIAGAFVGDALSKYIIDITYVGE
jgi:phage tail tape-measure protein